MRRVFEKTTTKAFESNISISYAAKVGHEHDCYEQPVG